MLIYEEQLAKNPRWALSEGSRHFEKQSAVQHALERIAKRLDELEIPYAVAGAMALYLHGYRRFTEDVDLLVSREGLKRIHEHLEGLGYVPPFTGSKNLRDAELGVRIEFIIAGQYPGDGKEKPVAFPDPEKASCEQEGIKVVDLRTLIELKLASGISLAARRKDISDVQEVIKTLSLPADFADKLDPYVQPMFRQLWNEVFGSRKRYFKLWRNEHLKVGARSIDELIGSLGGVAPELAAMRAEGVMLDATRNTADGYAYLVTFDFDVARKFGMHDEAEFWHDFSGEAPDHGKPA